jgi:hypothetical protein
MGINNAIVLSDDEDLEEKPSSAQAILDTNLDTKAPDSLADSDSTKGRCFGRQRCQEAQNDVLRTTTKNEEARC